MSDELKPADEAGEPEIVPRLSRRGGYISAAHIVRVVMLGALLVAIAVMGRPCADGVSEFIVSFGPPPGEVEDTEALGPGEVRRLTDEEIRERFPSLLEKDAGADPDADPEPAR